MIKLPDDSAFELAFKRWYPCKAGPYVKNRMKSMWDAAIEEVKRINAAPSSSVDGISPIKILQVGWLNKCRCGNKKLTVKTIKGNSSSLWDDDDVICNQCGRKGIIQCNEGHAGVWWETDEEYLESQRLNATAQQKGDPSTHAAKETRKFCRMIDGIRPRKTTHPYEQPVSDGLYQIANHIAGAKNSLPQEWQDWAEEIESDLRRLAAAPGGQDD